jgi:hypothetical protein
MMCVVIDLCEKCTAADIGTSLARDIAVRITEELRGIGYL